MGLELKGKHSEMMLSLLQSWTLRDENGIDGDDLKLVIHSSDIDGLPPKGEKYTVYLDEVNRGVFQISGRQFSVEPRTITITMTVSPFSIKDNSGFRERKSMSWNKATLGQVVSDCVSPHGFVPFVAPELQKIEIESLHRLDESTLPFLRKLAKRYDAIAKPVEDRFVFVPIGQRSTSSGKDIQSITLSLPDENKSLNSNFVNVSGDLDGRNDFSGVKAFYLDPTDSSRKEVSIGTAPFKRLGQDKNNQQEADQACHAELRKIQRQGRKVTIQAPAIATAFAEGHVILDSSFPSVAQGTYSIDSVSLSGAGKQATRMTLQATLLGE
jgi:hypothetical protein